MQLNDKYRVIRKLGDGGMGEVFLVEHLQLGRLEALKILRRDIAAKPRVVSRFRREARALYRLDHPNIMSVYEFGTLPDGRSYLSAEYAEGRSLRRVLRGDGAQSMPTAIRLVKQLAGAVAHAHTRGVIHRDLKPDNLIVVRDEAGLSTLKVLDFGIAKIVAPDHQDSIEITKYGSIRGTPRYMSPEQARGEGLDPRIDIYAIGCIAFELVVGTPPFCGPNAIVVMRAHLYEQPPALGEDRDSIPVPDDYERIVHRCLAKNPDDRFQTGKELLLALEEMPAVTRVEVQRGPVGERRSPAGPSAERISQARTIVKVGVKAGTELLAVGTDDFATRQVAADVASETQAWELPANCMTIAIELTESLARLGCDDGGLEGQLNLVREIQAHIDWLTEGVAELTGRRTWLQRELEQAPEESRGEAYEFARYEPRPGVRHERATLELGGELRVTAEKLASLEQECINRERDLAQAILELRQLAIHTASDHTRVPHIAELLARLHGHSTLNPTRP